MADGVAEPLEDDKLTDLRAVDERKEWVSCYRDPSSLS
jgi:hypothetical protein